MKNESLTLRINHLVIISKAGILTGVLLFLLSGIALASQLQYEGNGISFNYPDKYKITTTSKKSGEHINLKQGQNSIFMQITPNPLVQGFDDTVINIISKNFSEKNYAIKDIKKESKSIPLQVKGKKGNVQVDAVKYKHTVIVKKNELKITMLQTMFFFSYGDNGYFVNFTRSNNNYTDLTAVLSTLTFDKEASRQTSAQEGAY